MSQVTEKLPLTRRPGFRLSRGGFVGLAELIGLAVAAFMVLLVAVGYFYFLLPAKSSIATRLRDREYLADQVRSTNDLINVNQKTNVLVDEISSSLARFETERLADHEGGRMSLYQDLNDLMRKNGLRNSSGPAYTSLQPLALKTQGQAQASSGATGNKWQSLYPGIAVNVTVEGPYQNLRRFVRDIESSKDFIIINAVELEKATRSGSPVASEETSAPQTGSHSTLVSLRLDLATYFSRRDKTEDSRAESAPATH
jgi:Tfp pilus assembly protein PilO